MIQARPNEIEGRFAAATSPDATRIANSPPRAGTSDAPISVPAYNPIATATMRSLPSASPTGPAPSYPNP